MYKPTKYIKHIVSVWQAFLSIHRQDLHFVIDNFLVIVCEENDKTIFKHKSFVLEQMEGENSWQIKCLKTTR